MHKWGLKGGKANNECISVTANHCSAETISLLIDLLQHIKTRYIKNQTLKLVTAPQTFLFHFYDPTLKFGNI